MCSDCKLKTTHSMQSMRNSIIACAVSTDQDRAVFPRVFFLYFPEVNLTVPALLTAHHIIDLPAKKKVSAVSVFPLCCLNLVCKKATSRIMRVRRLTCLNKYFSTTQTVLRILCKRGLLAGLPGHSFCNNCSRHPNIEK